MKDSAVVRGAVVAVALVVAMTFPTATQSPPARAAQPIEPIGAIIEAFRSHSVVALGEDHGNEQGHAFRIRLLRDPRFTATVNDIVVEFGNPRYQELMDHFVKGEQVDDQALRLAWQDTTQISGVWDRPLPTRLAYTAERPPVRRGICRSPAIGAAWTAPRRGHAPRTASGVFCRRRFEV